MPEDRSLTDFAGADTTESTAPDDEDAVSEEVDEDATPEETETPDLDDVAPVEATYDFSPDGAACAACGATVTRRWRDDGEYVCEDCKEW